MEKSEAESKTNVAEDKNVAEETKKKPMSNAKKYTIVGVCALVLVGVGMFLGTWFSGGDPETVQEPIVERVYVQQRERVPTGGRGIVVTEDNLDEVRDRMETARRFGHFRTRMSNEWVFATATSASRNAYVENHTSNPGTVFIDVVLDGEVIYSSPYIPLGERLDGIILDVELPPGEYRPTVIYHILDEYNEVQATLSVRISLSILG